MKIKILKFFVGLTFTLKAQKNEYSTSISDSLKENANAIVRLNQIDVTISSQRSMTINKKSYCSKRKGLSAIDAIENYNKKTTVRY
jgi:hypothetical protein